MRQLWVNASQEIFRTQYRSKFPLPFRCITRVMSPCGKCTVVIAVYNNTFVKEKMIIRTQFDVFLSVHHSIDFFKLPT